MLIWLVLMMVFRTIVCTAFSLSATTFHYWIQLDHHVDPNCHFWCVEMVCMCALLSWGGLVSYVGVVPWVGVFGVLTAWGKWRVGGGFYGWRVFRRVSKIAIFDTLLKTHPLELMTVHATKFCEWDLISNRHTVYCTVTL